MVIFLIIYEKNRFLITFMPYPLKSPAYISLILLLSISSCFSQVKLVKENSKWGARENENFIIAPVYDTIFSFDSTQKICLACFRVKTASANKFIKTLTTSYSCRYLNKKNERLILRNVANDT